MIANQNGALECWSNGVLGFTSVLRYVNTLLRRVGARMIKPGSVSGVIVLTLVLLLNAAARAQEFFIGNPGKNLLLTGVE